jgi:DNA helicase-2/ATP-dependent DNA helicase PcrA
LDRWKRIMSTFSPTPEQQAILSAVKDSKDSLMITAMAGTGKTSTLVLIANALPVQPAIALAFNVQIKKELERRFPSYWKIMTLNGLGHRAWMSAIRGKTVTLDERKLGRLTTQVFKDFQYEGDEDAWSNIRQLVSKAMQAGIVPASRPHKGFRPDTREQWAMLADENWMQGIGEPEIDLAREILTRSVAEGFEGVISFEDQIYLPVCFNGQFPRYPLLMGDEVQDWSVMNRVMAQRTCAGRLILVGDPKQSIYSFRGADTGSMDRLKALRAKWIELPLSITFRCPKVVVDRQQSHAPGFTAFHTNALGQALQFKRYQSTRPQEMDFEHFGDFDRALRAWKEKGGVLEQGAPQTWDWKKVESSASHGTIAILCRNNAPLLKVAFKLLRENVPVTMLGRDIGKTLVALSKKVLPDDDMAAADCVAAVGGWKDSQVALANANGQEEKVANIHDQAECLLSVIEGARAENAAAIRWYLKELFERSAGHVTISTIHRAKGLEYDTVLHLDPWRIPSKFAQHNPAQMQQELNLRYVAETRCKRVLIEANLEDFE